MNIPIRIVGVSSLLAIAGCTNYAEICNQDNGESSPQPQIVDACRHLADKGDAKGEQGLAVILLRSGTAADLQNAVTLLRKAVDQNLPEAQYTLSTLYHEGKGVQPDIAQRVRLLKASASSGYERAKEDLGPAALELGELYETGTTGLAVDLQSAKQWYSAAADAGSLDAAKYLKRVRIKLGEIKPTYYLATGAVICANPYMFDAIRSAAQYPILRDRIIHQTGCAIQGQKMALREDLLIQPMNNGITSIDGNGFSGYVLSSDVKISYDE